MATRGTARKLKKYDDAIVAYSKIIELEPSALAYTNRGISYGMLGNYDQEINDYNKAIEIYPSAIAYNNRGFAYAMLGNNNHAIKDYDKAIELNPQLAVAYMNRAAMYQKIKKYEQSMADLKMAAKLGDKETQKLLSEYRIKW
ncbi:MAG: tetratricopeptide repeat protein [Smithella sp.]